MHKTLRQRGSTAWTVTNHNNARSCWELREQGVDTLSAAEWTCVFPEYDVSIHVLVYGFTPEQEPELERRRRNVYEFLRYCRKADLPVVQPHPLYFYARERMPPREIFEKFALLFERFEVCNGQRDGLAEPAGLAMGPFPGPGAARGLRAQARARPLGVLRRPLEQGARRGLGRPHGLPGRA